MKKVITALFLILILCAFSAFAEETDHTLLMIYMSGADLESSPRGGAGSRDIEEMIAAVPPDGGTRVVLLTGGTLSWKRPDIPWDENVLWEVTPEGLKRLSGTGPENMGNPYTLSAFLREAVDRFPADRYALILWDHGSGPVGGLCLDERPGGDWLSLPELKEALEQSPFADQPLLFIGMDACLMATVETACVLSPYAGCLIASQETEPADGWNYQFLSAISGEMSAEEIGQIIAKDYIDYYTSGHYDGNDKDYLTLSCVDLHQAPLLQEALNRMFSSISPDISTEQYNLSAEARTNTRDVGNHRNAVWDLIDFRDFLDELEAAGLCDVTETRNILDRMVLCREQSKKLENINGLSIYCPFENKASYTHPWGTDYQKIPFSEAYQSWVANMSRLWLGEPISSWRENRPIRAEASARRTVIATDLDPEEQATLTGSRLLVLEELPEGGEYRLIWSSEDARLTENGLLAAYSGEGLYALNAEGQVLAGPITWRNLNGGIAVGALLETPESPRETIYMICSPEENGEYTVSGVDTYSESVGMFMPSPMRLQAGDSLTFVSWYRAIPESGAAYENWPHGSICDVESVTVPEGGFILKMIPLNASHHCQAIFELKDTQANIHLTSLSPVENVTGLNLLEQPLSLESGGARLTLTDLALDSGAEKELRMTLHVKNESAQGTALEIASVVSDRTVLADMRTPPRENLEAGGETDWELVIPEGMLRDARIRETEALSLILKVTGEDGSVTYPEFSFPVAISFATLNIEDPAGFGPVAETAVDGLSGRIVEIRLDSGAVRGLMQLENQADTPVTITGSEVLLNEQEVYGSCCAGQLPLIIPAGKTAMCGFTVYPNDLTTNEPVPLAEDLSDLRQLCWRFRGSPDVRLIWTWEANP